MRFTPAALSLALLFAVGSSVSHSAPRDKLDPHTQALLDIGASALRAGRVNEAVDSFEAALVRQPGSVAVLLHLAQAMRANGLQGKALHYYREALKADPRNLAAIAGEGAALAEKGAIEKARRNLARLEGICGVNCAATRELAAIIASRPAKQQIVTAESAKPDVEVSEN
ncbi:MAG: tetratricopeptide repeat protein [Novosphingobium sp.]|nr:tetratricopeptide repeat protein [Novosphingobium sp.]